MSEPRPIQLPKEDVEKEQAAAAADEEVIDSSFADLLKNARPEDLMGVNPATEERPATSLPSSCWIHGPGRVELLSVAYSRLVKTAGKGVKYVDRVYAEILKDSKVLVMRPAPDTDTTAYEVKRYDGASSAIVNLSKLLRQHKLAVATGWKEHYTVAFIPAGSALGKGIAINLGAVKERSRTSKKDEE